jgi:hypothetical protein
MEWSLPVKKVMLNIKCSFAILSKVAWFILNGNADIQNNRHGCSKYPHAVHKIPQLTESEEQGMHINTNFFKETKFSCTVRLVLKIFFTELK